MCCKPKSFFDFNLKSIKVVLAGLLLLSGMTVRANDITIVADGKSNYKIVIPKDDPLKIVRKAAIVLQSFLKQGTGADLEIIVETPTTDGPAIYLGKTKKAVALALPLDKITGITWLKAVRGKNVFLIGNDAQGGKRPRRGFRYYGTLKAVTSFLEDQAGVRFLMAGPKGNYIPKLKLLTVPSKLYQMTTPRYAYIISGRPPRYLPYALANNYIPSNVCFSYGGHSYYSAVPKKIYGKTHPEYFALIKGVRNSNDNHLCVSNPEVQKLMLKELEKRFADGYQWVELAQTDGFKGCECEKCKAISENDGERLWKVHLSLAETIEKTHPDNKVMIISYGPTAKPPKTIKKTLSNVIVQLCYYSPEALKQWSDLKLPSTVYIYNWGTYHIAGLGPKRTPQYVAEQAKRFSKANVKGIYLCGAFENMGLEGPVYYVYGKMLENPNLQYQNILSDYYRSAFGKARAPMTNFFSAMYDRMSLHNYLDRPNVVSTPNFKSSFKGPEDWYCHYFPAKLLRQMRSNLNLAKKLATDPDVIARIKLVDLEFSYVENLAAMFQLYRSYRIKPCKELFEALAEKIDARRKFIDSCINPKTGRVRQFDGWSNIFSNVKKDEFLNGGRMLGLLTAPAGWNTELLRKNNILPGVGTKRAKIKRVSKINLDGKLEESVWSKLSSQPLNEISLGKLQNKSSFKIGYDEKALYIAFACDLEDIDSLLHLKPVGRDGGVWGGECVELFLDPSGTREKYFHFIFAPIPNSFYDARFGFVSDPIDPLYNVEDKSWNGDWKYKSHIDKKNKRWTAELMIPFKTLEAPCPASGVTWTMNIGREEFPGYGGTRHGEPVLSLWSPNLEERKFGSLPAFGELVFE